jgi:ParB family chromosome partitioning protein
MPEKPKIEGFAARILGIESSKGSHPVVAFTEDDAGRVVQIPPSRISPNPDQPRHYFDRDALAELTESVRTRGVLQPIMVRRDEQREGYFILIAGERRWRASKAAGLTKIPAMIRGPKDDPAELAIIENLQREDLNPIEEAESLERLKERRHLTDGALAKIVGKSRVSVTETLSLNGLPEPIKAECRSSDKFKKSQLLQVLRQPNSEAQLALWQAMKAGNITVREARAKTAAAKQTNKPGPKPYEHTFQPEDRTFTVRVKFRKSRATHDEIREALREAIKSLT